ncbi:MAG: hypothetical protein RI894_2444 [Bacteroidota bacterium]|jgi:hypothetical protein
MLKAFFPFFLTIFITNIAFGQCLSTQNVTAEAESATCIDEHSTATDGYLKITTFLHGQRYRCCLGTVFNDAIAVPNNIIAIPSDSIATSGLANPATDTEYTIRVYDATDDNCYTDVIVVLHPSLCGTLGSGDFYALKAPAGLTNYRWYLNGVFIPSSNTRTFIVNQVGKYTYTAEVIGGGCPQKSCTSLQLRRAATLPVQMIYFVAAANDCEVILRWQTATELNNREFVVQRSNGNNIWTTIGVVTGSGTSNAPRLYTFKDTKPQRENLYRLQQVDYDGTTTPYSAANKVQTTGCFEEIDNGVTLVYPNPNSTDQAWLKFYTDRGNEDVDIILTDVLGRVLMVQTNGVQNGANIVAIDISSLPSGHFYVYVKGAGWQSDTQKLIRIGR